MATIQCPTCGTPFNSTHSMAMPFCCERCRQLDLGGWLNEEHGVPVERDPDEEAEIPWMEDEQPIDGSS